MAASDAQTSVENAEPAPRKAFFVSPIGDEDSPQRLRSDNLLEGLIRPELESRNISIVCADKLPNADSVTEQVVGNLLNSDLVVCDLARRDANVFYELGIAEALRTPSIILADEEQLPFRGTDTRVIRIPDQDGGIDAFEIRNYRLRFGRAVDKVLEDGYDPNTPVSRAAELVSALDTRTADPVQPDSRDLRRRHRWTRSPNTRLTDSETPKSGQTR